MGCGAIEQAVAALTADPAAVSHAERIELLITLARLRDAVEAVELRTLAALAAGDKSERRWVSDEIACALSIAPVTAQARLQDAAQLGELLPETTRQVTAGTASARQARVLLDLTRPLPDTVRATVEATVLPKAAGRTTAEFRRSVRRAVAATDPRGLEDRHAAATADRYVSCTQVEHGMSELHALLPTDGAARLMARVHDLARRSRTGNHPTDNRTADQCRADALITLADTPTARADGLTTATRRTGPTITVTVPLATITGDSDHPGELAGHGPLPASITRRLATDPTATWRRILTDPAGTPVDAAHTYQPPAALEALIIARDHTCRFPGCSQPAHRAEIDHITAWADGGLTTETNLHALCARHHHLKHDAAADGHPWHVHRQPNGNTVWRSPTGRTYVKPPDDTIDTYLPRPDPPNGSG